MSDIVARLTDSLANRCRIVREVGEGGMATVFLAHDVKHDRAVATSARAREISAFVKYVGSAIPSASNLAHTP